MRRLRVHLELTNICNLNCVFCAKSVMKRKLGYMNSELAAELIDELSGDNFKLEKLFFHLMGEPILHPDFIRLAQYATDKGLPLSIYTNGSLFNDNIIDSIFDIDPPELVISFQTPNRETFGLKGALLSYDEYFDNIKNLIVKKRNSKARTKIELRLLNTKKDNIFSSRFWLVDRKMDILEDKSKLKNFLITLDEKLKTEAMSINADEIIKRISLSKPVFKVEIFKDIFLVGTTYFSWYNRQDTEDPHFKKAYIGGCDGFRSQLAILWDGSVVSCCVDYDGENCVGNVTNKKLKDILNNGYTRNFIHKLNKCILPTNYCQICRGAKNIRVWLTKQLGSIFIYNFIEKIKEIQ